MFPSLATVSVHSFAIWFLSLLSIALILARPKGVAEAWWASLGAACLVVLGLIPIPVAAHAIAEGTDVYLFLIGMMIMSELARREGVFDWIAARAVSASKGSQARLFFLIYCFGTIVTVFLSNDATAVVLTPAVLAAVRAARTNPFPYLMVCAFVANAASFVFPISNPANLVVYGSQIPPLNKWVITFGLPSVAAIVVTYLVLRWIARKDVSGAIHNSTPPKALSPTGRVAVYGILFLALVLLVVSAVDWNLGAPTFLVSVLVGCVVTFFDKGAPKDVVKEVSWSVLPLVAGLFVIVSALNAAGALHLLTVGLQSLSALHFPSAALISGFGIALLSNVINNLPVGLISSAAAKSVDLNEGIRAALLLGVDIGPNLSVSGSLATILWLIAIRRDGEHVSFWKFLKWGSLVMPPSLAAAILVHALIVIGR
jgi:arsenical pump membrane protein